MIPARGYNGHFVAVLGLGKSGLAVAESLLEGGATVRAWDDGAAAREAAVARGIDVDDLSKDRPWEDVAALFVSPGIPHLYPEPHPVIAKAQSMGVVIDNDIGLFFRSYATPDWDQFDRLPRIVCVTGSNGKSTTTALIHHVLSSSGRPVQMGGNIGRPALDLEPAHDGEVVVLELSSYQTDLARALAPDIAVFLNLSPDHLERHGGIGGYYAAKERLFTLGGPERAVIGVDQTEGRFLAARLREEANTGDPVIRVSTTERLKTGWSINIRKGFLSEWRRDRQVASIDLRDMPHLPGVHNHQNAAAAYGVLRALGLGAREIENGLSSFPGLKHRCQIVGVKQGVTFVNDSKATNADAAEKALLSFDRIRWIAGGQAKAGGISSLAPLFDRVRKTYLIGQDAPSFAEALGDHPSENFETLDRSFAAALADSEPGDVILLSPAAASWDQFASFEARGDAFEALVAAVPGE